MVGTQKRIVSGDSREIVRKKGLEPLRPYGHQLLRLARLPIPPLPRGATVYHSPHQPIVALDF